MIRLVLLLARRLYSAFLAWLWPPTPENPYQPWFSPEALENLPDLEWMHEENDPGYVPPRPFGWRDMALPYVRLLRPRLLATIPGDVLAGIAFAAATGHARIHFLQVFAMCAATVFLAAAGAADNDIVDIHRDIQSYRRRSKAKIVRPAADGYMPLFIAGGVRLKMLAISVAAALAGSPGRNWLFFFALQIAAVFFYNRIKDRYTDYGIFAISAFRAISVAGAALAASPAGASDLALCQIGFFAIGMALYQAAISYTGLDKEFASSRLPQTRYFWGCGIFVSFAAFLRMKFAPEADLAVPLAVGWLAAFAIWILAVAPLGRRHNLAKRQKTLDLALCAYPVMQTAATIAPATGAWCFAAFALAGYAWLMISLDNASATWLR